MARFVDLVAQSGVHRFEVIVTLLGAVLAILSTLSAGVWKVAGYVNAQSEATDRNTAALADHAERLARIETAVNSARDAARAAPQAIIELARQVDDDER